MTYKLDVVVATKGGQPVGGVVVQVIEAATQKYSDQQGYVSFDLNPGTYTVLAQRPGFRAPKPVDQLASSTQMVQITITVPGPPTSPSQLITLVVDRSEVIYLDIEHASVRDREWGNHQGYADRVQAGARAVVATASVDHIWYGDVSDSELSAGRFSGINGPRQENLLAVVISGNGSEWSDYSPTAFEVIKKFIQTTEIPILAVCNANRR